MKCDWCGKELEIYEGSLVVGGGELADQYACNDCAAKLPYPVIPPLVFDTIAMTEVPLPPCPLCDEPVRDSVDPEPLYTPEGPRLVHSQCMLREVLGGIGHLIAHEWWCEQKHDPDAGLTRRQSSLLASAWVTVMGDGEPYTKEAHRE